jgi:hypothetical protein
MTGTRLRASANPVLRRLDVLVGEWQMDAIVDGQVVARSRNVFEWLENGMFLVQHAVAEPPLPTTPPEWVTHSPFPITTVIGLDDMSGQFYLNYADGRDVHRVYPMTMESGVWKFWGQAGPEFYQRFTGTFSADGKTIAGRIEQSRDGEHWETDFEQVYTKLT